VAEVYETDVYRGQAERALTEEERVAIRLLVVADPWAGRPSGIDPALFRMKWRNHDVWYTFSREADKVTLITLTAHGEAVANSSEDVSAIKALVDRLRKAGMAIGMKELVEFLLRLFGA
jgi:hypothetical protein